MEAPQEAGFRDCLPLAPKSQDVFVFEWTDPEKGINGQLTWTRLPQGFKNSPTIFDEALHEDLGEFRSEHPHLTLLQHVDDILLAAEDRDTCLRGTKDLLQTVAALGYRASAKKAQICRTEVSYLRYKLKDGQRWLTDAQKETILRIPQPKQSARYVNSWGQQDSVDCGFQVLPRWPDPSMRPPGTSKILNGQRP